MIVVERAPTWLRRGGGVFLAGIALPLTVVATLESAWGLYIAAVVFLAGAVWWTSLARITVTVDDDHLALSGPLWKHTMSRQSVRDVLVTEDGGTNTGMVNWPVTRHERGSLIRMTMGGSAAVTFSEAGGRRYQIVLADRPSAERLAEAVIK